MIGRANIRGAYALFLLLTVQAGAAECVAVEGSAVPVSAFLTFVDPAPALPMDWILTSTPDPGTRRWITAAEMRQWGLSPRESLAAAGVCVERQQHPLQSEEVMREIQVALQQDHGGAHLAGITSVQPLLVPKGHLRLPASGFQLLSDSSGFCSFLWRGAVEFDSHRLIGVRILGRYQAETVRYVAKRNLQPGDVLSASDYEVTAKAGCSRGAEGEPASPEGSIIRRALNEGDKIDAAVLRAPTVVEQGTAVRVIALAGGASVTIEAIAEKPGRRGESVFVQNKETGKRIRVLLTGRGEASAAVAGATR
jgi:flagella basal body P-ring formation protein FlgA